MAAARGSQRLEVEHPSLHQCNDQHGLEISALATLAL